MCGAKLNATNGELSVKMVQKHYA